MASLKCESGSYDVSIDTTSSGGVDIFVDPKWSGESQSVYLDAESTRKLIATLVGDMTLLELAELISSENKDT